MNRNETIRHEILLQLYGHRPGARDAERLAATARREGELPDATPAEFTREAAYLVGRNLIAIQPEDIAQAHKRWSITAAGVDYLESRGLV